MGRIGPFLGFGLAMGLAFWAGFVHPPRFMAAPEPARTNAAVPVIPRHAAPAPPAIAAAPPAREPAPPAAPQAAETLDEITRLLRQADALDAALRGMEQRMAVPAENQRSAPERTLPSLEAITALDAPETQPLLDAPPVDAPPVDVMVVQAPEPASEGRDEAAALAFSAPAWQAVAGPQESLAARDPQPVAARSPASATAPDPRRNARVAGEWSDATHLARAGERSAATERCQQIVLKVQLGEEPSHADRSFLRNGCR